MSALRRALWSICAKDATQELRRRVAIVAVFFFAATALALVSYRDRPVRPARGGPPAARRRRSCGSSSSSPPRRGCPAPSSPRRRRAPASRCARPCRRRSCSAARRSSTSCSSWRSPPSRSPGFSSCSTGGSAPPSRSPRRCSPAATAWRSSRPFSRRSSPRAGQRNVLFVLIAFPLVLPLLLTAIAATIEADGGERTPWTALRVLVAYDGAASGAAYMLAEVAWED